jgi:cell division protein DivIC
MENTENNPVRPQPIFQKSKKVYWSLPKWLKNKYTISLILFAFIMFFFDKNDFFTQQTRLEELRGLERAKLHLTKEITTESKELQALKSSPAVLEQYAREKHFMKRENEDLFIVPEKPVSGN